VNLALTVAFMRSGGNLSQLLGVSKHALRHTLSLHSDSSILRSFVSFSPCDGVTREVKE
jgi:hypothetical protein